MRRRRKHQTLFDCVKRPHRKPRNRWEKGWQTRRRKKLLAIYNILTTPNPILSDLLQ